MSAPEAGRGLSDDLVDLAEALRLVEYALHLRMYGENAPGGDETWVKWDRMAEDFLRDSLCKQMGHDPDGNCCPALQALGLLTAPARTPS